MIIKSGADQNILHLALKQILRLGLEGKLTACRSNRRVGIPAREKDIGVRVQDQDIVRRVIAELCRYVLCQSLCLLVAHI